ncbi:hypothetical protein FSARC_1070 [Fusarium sarcochroum]|uniref:Transcription factor domain-containing protein n=1 Tax=Fusarium sarcochroum TaxID=1208366 RepID=A0A8H4XEP0_9HYPO|nr:hypothetical protein FSARC_1070 [Fusarium sarcochroum]
MELVAALTLGALYSVEESRALQAWTLISAAMTFCQTLGYHRLDTSKGENVLHDIQIRLFWAVYTYENSLSLRLGRCSSIRESDITLPTEPNQHRSIQVGRIQGKVYDQLYSPTGLSSTSNERGGIAQSLAQELQLLIDESQEDVAGALSHSGVCQSSLLAMILRAIPGPGNMDLSGCYITVARNTLDLHDQCMKLVNGCKNPLLIRRYINWAILHTPFVPFSIVFTHAVQNFDMGDIDRLDRFAASFKPENSDPEPLSHPYRLYELLCQAARFYIKSRLPSSHTNGAPSTSSDLTMPDLELTNFMSDMGCRRVMLFPDDTEQLKCIVTSAHVQLLIIRQPTQYRFVMHASAVHASNKQPFSASFSGISSTPYSLFEIRLERDFIVFHGSQHESSDQLLKGVVVLCLHSPLKLEDIRLRLDGTLRHAWPGTNLTARWLTDPGVAHTTHILKHKWPAFVRNSGKSVVVPAGNYEWPFELMLPNDTLESLEGIREASIVYGLRATISRGKLARQMCSSKQVRVIRTLSPTALEFMHTMSIEQTWIDKVDYSVSIPTKAAVFGGSVMLEMRFTPLVKAIELERIIVTLVEFWEFSMHSRHYVYTREHKSERKICSWDLKVSRERDWQDNIEETSQEGWVINKRLPLPKRLRECAQDIDAQGIKIRHKLKIHIPIQNQDGHISHLDMGLPVHIFISPFMALDEQGALVNQISNSQDLANETSCPPGYGEHILDQLYENMEDWQISDQNPQLLASDVRESDMIAPRRSDLTAGQMAECATDQGPLQSRHNDLPSRNSSDAASTDSEEFLELSKVPTYRTAIRSPIRSCTQQGGSLPPDYRTTAVNDR